MQLDLWHLPEWLPRSVMSLESEEVSSFHKVYLLKEERERRRSWKGEASGGKLCFC